MGGASVDVLDDAVAETQLLQSTRGMIGLHLGYQDEAGALGSVHAQWPTLGVPIVANASAGRILELDRVVEAIVRVHRRRSRHDVAVDPIGARFETVDRVVGERARDVRAGQGRAVVGIIVGHPHGEVVVADRARVDGCRHSRK